jgi:hypothetical protein
MDTSLQMKTCPACAAEVSPLWATCRACGALLIAPPAPVSAPAAPTPAVAPHSDFYASIAPVVVRPPASTRASWQSRSIIAAIIVAIAFGGYQLVRPRPHATAAPEVLAPRAPTAGLPSSLHDVVRMQAESTRKLAMQAVERLAGEEGRELTVTALAQTQPGYQWIAGDQASTTNTMISFDDTQGAATVAVSTSSREVCAFGRFTTAGGPSYVTMANLPQCRAIDAPADGWSTEAGGAPSDLPDEG